MKTLPLVVLALAVTLAGTVGLAGPASAIDPTPPPVKGAPPNETPNERIGRLQQNLESLASKYIEAEQAVDQATTARDKFARQLTEAQLRIALLQKSVSKYAAEVYKTGRIGVLGVMLNTQSPDQFLSRATALEKITSRDQARLDQYRQALDSAREARVGLDDAVKTMTTNRNKLVELTSKTENGLLGMRHGPTFYFVDPNWKKATASPRNSDGGWSPQGRTAGDPSRDDGARITPRTRHAYLEAQKAGFKRPGNCYRDEDSPFEHPKGRACDFSAEWQKFNNRSAKGDDKEYGSRLAYFLVKNAKALGVMYVVWYCDIWIVSTGWRNYRSSGGSCGDSPAGDHTNHVHMSIY